MTPRFGEGDLGKHEGEDAGLIRDGEEDEAVIGGVGEANDAALRIARFSSVSFEVKKASEGERRTFDLDSILALNFA